MSDPTIVIERLHAGAQNQMVAVIGRSGTIGSAVWDKDRACHCLRMPLSKFQPERRAIVERMGKRDHVSFDVEGLETAPSDLEIILVDYQLEDETAEKTLLRLISHLNVLQAWTPARGKKPELETAKPCSPHAS